MKKILTLFTALTLLGSMMTTKADTYVVAGSSADIFGDAWKGSKTENAMTWNEERSLYVKSYTVSAAVDNIELKVVKNGSEWKGDFRGENIKFNLKGAGSFNVLYNTTTEIAFVEGSIVEQTGYSVYAVGNGSGNWLNGKNWSVNDDANIMKEVEPNLWEIKFTDVPAGNGRQIKFAINGSWTVNFGGTFSSIGTATDAVSSGDNITFNMASATDIIAQLDLRNCKSDKSGAKFTISNGPAPEQDVNFSGLDATILKGNTVNFAATSTNITNPSYTFYVKQAGGSYGSAVSSYTFNTIGDFVVKVVATGDNTSDPVVKEANVSVYDTHTFTEGTTIYVDFSAMTEGTKGINYPKVDQVGVDYDVAGAGGTKTVTFSTSVTWTTNDIFIKTEKAGWAELKFKVPTAGQNWVKIAENGASYTWDTYSGDIPVEPEHTYTVAGPEAFFGTNWNATTAANDMTLVDGLYKLTKANVVVAGGTTIEFKVCKDHSWDVAFPSENYSLYFANGGTYSITYTFNTTGNVVGVDIPSFVSMHGNFTGVDTWADTKNFVVAPGGATASLTMNLAARDNYQFGMRLRSNSNWTANGSSFSRATPSASIVAGEGNITFNADKTGEYTFTWTFATNTLTITYPEESEAPAAVTLKGEWNWGEGLTFEPDAGGLTTRATKYLNAGNYDFKLIVGETDPEDEEHWDWRSNTYKYHRYFTGASGITENLDNMELQADADGDYIFTWTFADNSLSITFPETPVTGTNIIKFFAPRDEEHTWESDVYVYSWARGAGNTITPYNDWTAVPATKNGIWYEATVQKGACVFFHDNRGMQSYDIENVQADLCYVADEIDNSEHEADPEKPIKVKFKESCEVSYYLTGDAGIAGPEEGNAWNAKLEALKLDGSNSITLENLIAGVYEFKITNGSWAWSLGGKEHLNTSCSNGAATTGNGNVKFKIESVQDVTISYDPATQKICLDAETVLPFEVVRAELVEDRFYTLCLNSGMQAVRGASLWAFESRDAEQAYLVEAEAPYAPGKPYIIYAESDKMEAILDGTTITAGVNGALHGTFVEMDQDALNAVAEKTGSPIYLLSNNMLWRVTGGEDTKDNRLAAGRAYLVNNELDLVSEAPQPAPGRRVRAVPLHQENATGIGEVQSDKVQGAKVLIDGQLYILYNGAMYNVQGARVK